MNKMTHFTRNISSKIFYKIENYRLCQLFEIEVGKPKIIIVKGKIKFDLNPRFVFIDGEYNSSFYYIASSFWYKYKSPINNPLILHTERKNSYISAFDINVGKSFNDNFLIRNNSNYSIIWLYDGSNPNSTNQTNYQLYSCISGLGKIPQYEF